MENHWEPEKTGVPQKHFLLGETVQVALQGMNLVGMALIAQDLLVCFALDL